ncbi:hypothetical protein EVAR_24159_1 [Eumeta japonica]|uniref:Uncharacterized protein n=1 Tax=Eumeta variegata TaxID=151549 RepID=A0A4C1W377_EUMVA|nr:hypothetical protein EVAR_24159_1 [Eumeta japonica]
MIIYSTDCRWAQDACFDTPRGVRRDSAGSCVADGWSRVITELSVTAGGGRRAGGGGRAPITRYRSPRVVQEVDALLLLNPLFPTICSVTKRIYRYLTIARPSAAERRDARAGRDHRYR